MIFMVCGQPSLREFVVCSTKKPALKRTQGLDAVVTRVQTAANGQQCIRLLVNSPLKNGHFSEHCE
jgi:hypothetical protein